MPIFIVKAVERSADGRQFAHVHAKWPVEIGTLDEAKAFADSTPEDGSGWSQADTFEIVDHDGDEGDLRENLPAKPRRYHKRNCRRHLSLGCFS